MRIKEKDRREPVFLFGGSAAGRGGEFYAAARLHLIRPLRGHLPLKGKATACGRGHLIRHGCAVPPVSLRVGRSAGLTRHRRVIQHREPLEGKANGGAPAGAGWGVSCSGTSTFLSSLKERYQRKPLKERGISNFPLSLRILSP